MGTIGSLLVVIVPYCTVGHVGIYWAHFFFRENANIARFGHLGLRGTVVQNTAASREGKSVPRAFDREGCEYATNSGPLLFVPLFLCHSWT